MLAAVTLALGSGCGPDVPAAPRRTTSAASPPAVAPAVPRPESFYDVHGDTLSTPHHGHIRLNPGHAAAEARTRIVLSPSAERVLVETNLGACGPRAAHRVDLVVLASRRVTRLAEGSGWVKARFAGEEATAEPQACGP